MLLARRTGGHRIYPPPPGYVEGSPTEVPVRLSLSDGFADYDQGGLQAQVGRMGWRIGSSRRFKNSADIPAVPRTANSPKGDPYAVRKEKK